VSAWASILAGIVKLAGLVAGMLDRRQVEFAGRAKERAERAAETKEREDDANTAARRARSDLRADPSGLRDKHFRD